MADFLSQLAGTLLPLFQIGDGGPQLKANGSNLDLRNDDDTAFSTLRIADGTNPEEAITKQQLDAITAAPSAVYIELLDLAGGQVFESGYSDFAWDTERLKTSEFTFSATSAEVTIGETGVYFLSFSLTMDVESGNGRSDWQARLVADQGSGFSEIEGWGGYVYSRNNAQGKGTLTKGGFYQFSAGDIVKVQAGPATGNNDYESVAGRSNLSIFRLNGAKGDTGPPGVGSTVNAYDESVLVKGSPFSGFNFVGPGVAATPSIIPGAVDVTVPGLATPDFARDETVSQTTSTGFTTKLTLQFNAPTSNSKYRIDWQAEVRANDDPDTPTRVQVELDGTLFADVGHDAEDNTGEPNTRWQMLSGFDYRDDLTSGFHTVELSFASGESGKEVEIRRVRIFAQRYP